MLRKSLAVGLAVLVHLGIHSCTSREHYIAGRDDGINAMEAAVANCSLSDARMGQCFIPCATDSDCVEKNGREEY
jgi:hypothetical protein